VGNNSFLKNYLQPSLDGLDRQFTLPLPDEDSLDKTAEFIVQSHCPPTYSTNVIARYENRKAGMRLVEVYKNSQNSKSGKFVRLVGSMSLVKKGYPFLFFDAAVTNINLQTGRKAAAATRIALHMPQAGDNGRQRLMTQVARCAEDAGFACSMLDIAALPPFWGRLLSVRRPGIDLEAIAQVRTFAWQAYGRYCGRSAAVKNFDYQPVQQQMIIKNSKAEQGQFRRMGLEVPEEVQAAFFSVLCTGV
jgi:hypothetical protein